jgi:hypothetical protein
VRGNKNNSELLTKPIFSFAPEKRGKEPTSWQENRQQKYKAFRVIWIDGTAQKTEENKTGLMGWCINEASQVKGKLSVECWFLVIFSMVYPAEVKYNSIRLCL